MLPTEQIRKIIDSQPEWFERQVLAGCCKNAAFYDRHKSTLNVNTKDPKEKQHDFALPQDNVIYELVQKYRAVMSGTKGLEVMSPQFVQVTLQAMVSASDLLVEQAEHAWQRFHQIASEPVETMIPMVDVGFPLWLSRRRVRRVAQEMSDSDTWDPEQLVRDINYASVSANAAKTEKYKFNFGDGWLSRQLDIRRLQTGFTQFDRTIGGGFGYGEFALGIASTGGGKTICGLQFGATFAFNGEPGLYITTEQANRELEPRVVSNLCNIPFSLIKDGIFPEKFEKQRADQIEELRRRLETSLVFVNWNQDRSKTVTEDLETEVLKYCDERGHPPRWVIFDWIGGALGQLTKQDMMLTRLIYQKTADKLADLAEKHNNVTLGFVQANPAQSKNSAQIGPEHITECKTVGNRATVIFGISNIRAGEESMNEGGGAYQEKQFFYISKARKGTGGMVPFTRRFDFQRIAKFD